MKAADFARLVTLAAIWSLSFIFMRVVAPPLGPVWTAALRVLIGGAALVAWLALTGRDARLREHWRAYLVIGIVNSALPFFLFAYFWDPHYDYLPPPPYDTMFVSPEAQRIDLSRFETNPAIYAGMPPAQLAYILSQYAGEIRATDEYLGRFFALLKQQGLWQNTAILITADHGEEFFDHGEKGHKNNLFAETTHVPLLLKLPGSASGRVDRRLASHVDVLPTLLELAGVSPDFPIQGRSLLERSPPPSRAIFFDLLSTWYYRRLDGSPFDVTQRWHGVREGDWKLVWREGGQGAPLSALYDAVRDPADREDVSAANESRSRTLESLYQAQRSESEAIAAPHPLGGSAQLSPRELEALRALGYVSP